MRTTTGTLLALSLALAACTPGVLVASPRDLDPQAALAGRLVGFDTCDDLLTHLQDEASERVGPYGLDGSGYPWPLIEGDGFVTAETAAAADSARAGAESAAGTTATYTGTNTQEAGVDEPDILKTDGTRILTISENVLTHVDLSGEEPKVTDSLRLEEGWAHELFFAGDRAFLVTNSGTWGGPIPLAERDIAPPGAYAPSATVVEIDLTDPSNLRVEATLEVEGQYLSARAVGDAIRLAMSSPPSRLEWVYPATPASEERAERFNRQLIAETTIDDWLPEYELTVDGSSAGGRLVDCQSVHRPAEFAGFDLVSVLSLDLARGLTPGAGVGVLASGQTVYSSTERFYVATSKWIEPEAVEAASVGTVAPQWSENYTTSIHAFDITADGAASYVASGEVKGSLLNQFSMDEHDGRLRVITTDGSPWDERNQSESFLTVLEERDTELVEVGRVGGLGKGESLYSARLLDDIGFAVTFRTIDPFYVLDLSDPTTPAVVGELKVPGFSTYLHPVGDDLVLGVGQQADENGATQGFKVSLFSVADPAAPVELDSWVVKNANSPTEYDHRAFQFLPDQNLAIVPLSSWDAEFNGAVLLRVAEGSLEEVGRITHVRPEEQLSSDCTSVDDPAEDSELYYIEQSGGHVQVCDEDERGGYGGYYCERIPADQTSSWGIPNDVEVPEGGRVEVCWPDDGNYREQIQRSLVIGDTVWTMSTAHLQANRLDGLAEVARVDIGG